MLLHSCVMVNDGACEQWQWSQNVSLESGRKSIKKQLSRAYAGNRIIVVQLHPEQLDLLIPDGASLAGHGSWQLTGLILACPPRYVQV